MKQDAPKTKRLNVPAELKDKLAAHAEKKGMTVDELAAYVLQGYMTEEELMAKLDRGEEFDPLPESYPPSKFAAVAPKDWP